MLMRTRRHQRVEEQHKFQTQQYTPSQVPDLELQVIAILAHHHGRPDDSDKSSASCVAHMRLDLYVVVEDYCSNEMEPKFQNN